MRDVRLASATEMIADSEGDEFLSDIEDQDEPLAETAHDLDLRAMGRPAEAVVGPATPSARRRADGAADLRPPYPHIKLKTLSVKCLKMFINKS